MMMKEREIIRLEDNTILCAGELLWQTKIFLHYFESTMSGQVKNTAKVF